MKVLQRTLLALAAAGFAVAAQAQDIRLYAFSSGTLTFGKGFLVNMGAMDPPTTFPVGFYVVRHPRGTVLFDTGNNDKLIADPNYWPQPLHAFKPAMTPEVAIDVQLRKIGLSPDDITYVVVSHLHLDHGGNIGKFPKSTLVVQRDEINNAFWPRAGTGFPYVLGDFAHLRDGKQRMIQLDGDMDLFGDGTVVVKRWVAHTPGSQMMTVRLKNTGLVILTGDNVYVRENVEKNVPPNIVLAYYPTGYYTAYEWIRQQMASQKADFFTAHDPDAFKAMKKAPEYYD